jgi:cell division transport system ATP-binding protein
VEVLGMRAARAARSALPPLRRRIGVVHQEFRLLAHLSAWDNVALPLRLAGRPESSLRADVAEMLDWIGLEAKEERSARGALGRRAAAPDHRARRGRTAGAAGGGRADLGTRCPPGAAAIALLAEMNRLGTTVVVATHSEDLPARHPARMLTLEAGRAGRRWLSAGASRAIRSACAGRWPTGC